MTNRETDLSMNSVLIHVLVADWPFENVTPA